MLITAAISDLTPNHLPFAFTENQTIGGRAWPNVQFDSRAREIAYSLWGNSTLGLLLYWWHSSRQQAGRGSMPVTAIRTMPTLDVTQLTSDQLTIAEQIFDDMRDYEFLPANEAYRRRESPRTRPPRDAGTAWLANVSHGPARTATNEVVLRAKRARGQGD